MVVGAGVAIGVLFVSSQSGSATPEAKDTPAQVAAAPAQVVDEAPVEKPDGNAEVAREPIAEPVVAPERLAAATSAPIGTDDSPLGSDNPRWAVRTGADKHPAVAAVAALADARNEEGPKEAGRELGYATAAVDAEQPLEVEQKAAPAPKIAEPKPAAAAPAPAEKKPEAAAPPAASSRARVSTAVNMRRGPDNGAGVVAVIPGGAEIGIIECRIWCHVEHDGRSGYIFKRFVRQQVRAESQNAKSDDQAPTPEEMKADIANHRLAQRGGR